MAFFCATLFTSHAQTNPTTKDQSNLFFIGHTIHVFKTGTGYGYDISYHNRLWAHQTTNPFTSDPNGLQKEEDAIKLAKWQVVHYHQFSPQPAITAKKTFPKSLATQLKIATN